MKKQFAALALMGAAASSFANPGVFVGLTYDFGGQWGVSLKLLSTDRQDRAAVAAGVTYHPSNKTWGADAGVAYLMRDSAATFGWDFLRSKFQMGVGYVHTKHDDAAPAAPAPAPAVIPVTPPSAG